MKTRWLLALAALLVHPGLAPAQPPAGEEEGGDDLPPMMRDPRQLSGVARGEANDPAGLLTVRVVQGALKRTEFGDIRGQFPARALVHLIGIGVGGKISHRAVPLDSGGRAVFDRLNTSGAENYVAVAILPRPSAEDRLVSRLVPMPPQVGMRMMLAGEAVDSDKPPVDDLLVEEDPTIRIPEPGVVVIQLRGNTRNVQEVELLQAGVEAPIARTKVQVATIAGPADGRVAPPEDDRALRPGVIEVLVARRGQGVAHVPVEVVAAGAAPRTAATDPAGRALFEPLPAGAKVTVRATVQGRTFESAAFDAPRQSGQRVRVEVDWREAKGLEARFTGVASGADKVYLARAAGQSRPYLTMPFQLTAARGAAANLILAPDILFAFHGGASIEDERLEFQLQMTLYNASLVPYDPGPGGLSIPLGRGFLGASVDEESSPRVKVDEGRGLVWRGLLPPGERRFIAAFGMGTADGKATLEIPLPYGLWNSQLVFEKTPGLSVEAPDGVKQQSAKTDDGRPLLVFPNMQFDRGEVLRFHFSGLPQHPGWQLWVPRLIGLAVLALLGWGIAGVARRSRRSGGRQSHLEAEREELLQAVVHLEADLRRGKVTDPVYQERRRELQRQLEEIYAGLAAEEASLAAGRRSNASA